MSNEGTDFLEKLYPFTHENDIERILDLIFDTIDELFLAGRFEIVDEMVRLFNFERVDPPKLINTLTGILCITLAAKTKLPSRPDFYLKAEQQFLKTESAERTKRLLENLI